MGDLGGEPPKRLVFSIDDKPVVLDVIGLGTICSHYRSPGHKIRERGWYWRAIALSTVNLPVQVKGDAQLADIRVFSFPGAETLSAQTRNSASCHHTWPREPAQL